MTVYGLGPYIADYPEQLLLSGVVQNWCPRCLANSKDLDGTQLCLHRCEAHTELLIEQLPYKQVWREYGIVSDIVDHLVNWVEDYLNVTHSTGHAAKIMDDIDRRIAAVALFAGLQHFPHGCGFQKWTGDDSKALMKVYLAAIEGHVPQDVVCTFSAFLDFCYLVRCETLTEEDLTKLQDALDCFYRYQEIFKTTCVVSTFSLLRQHSLCHYISLIQLFGVPNGLSVKEPWCHSSRFKALLTNQRLDKLAAAHADFEACSMLCQNDHEDGYSESDDDVAGEFIHEQQHSEDPDPPEFNPMTAQVFLGKVTIFNSAAATFHVPSDLSGTGATPSWCGGAPRHDCIFINMGANFDSPISGLAVACVLCFFSFSYWMSYFPYTIVCWYSHVLQECDPDTGMYIVTPATTNDGAPDISIIHVNLYGPDFIPTISLDK
ncbi:hypothetical protein DFH29DRAFT_985457 [Suillus ampliporus]|nr:hypothetical protein DFH29DRAFT_985457 [Suillus ampliporus]